MHRHDVLAELVVEPARAELAAQGGDVEELERRVREEVHDVVRPCVPAARRARLDGERDGTQVPECVGRGAQLAESGDVLGGTSVSTNRGRRERALY